MLGRPIEIVVADANSDPVTAVLFTRQMGHDGINLLCGCVTNEVALAVTSELQPANAVMITCLPQALKLTHEAFVPNLFRVTDQIYMRSRAHAWLMVKRYPDIATWHAILPDNECGRTAWEAFKDGLLNASAEAQAVVTSEPILVTGGETDFTKHIAALQQRESEALFIAVNGEDAVSFYRQARRTGLFTGLKALADPVNEFDVPRQLGYSIPEDLWLAMSWYYGGYLDTHMGRRLYGDYLRRTGNGLPLGFLNAGHSAVYAYAAAIRKAGSIETQAVIDSLEGLTFDTAKGNVTLRRQDHQAVCDINFVRMKSSAEPLAMDINDGERSDIEVAEFIRYNGADVIEAPNPGKKMLF